MTFKYFVMNFLDIINKYQDLIGSVIGVLGSYMIMKLTLKHQSKNDRDNAFDAEIYSEKYKGLTEFLDDAISINDDFETLRKIYFDAIHSNGVNNDKLSFNEQIDLINKCLSRAKKLRRISISLNFSKFYMKKKENEKTSFQLTDISRFIVKDIEVTKEYIEMLNSCHAIDYGSMLFIQKNSKQDKKALNSVNFQMINIDGVLNWTNSIKNHSKEMRSYLKKNNEL